ncbi:uncharacterized protein BJ212DRAFT_1343450 [Suillus subaureus]|uniref:Uncharacterized protein n=1 Tax=Suillus subaureus TaxID=48587 RepID=A0A9P7JFW4_9AGAM|nr:uncharacterized protein BJ212DRAFT_1343450 [Suillus subaureus]KAG1819849.1 hypothetical protein BJ212DRAFT_1343450 [Suillus subaureus]
MVMAGTMKPIQFVYLAVLAAFTGVNAISANDAQICLEVCADSPLPCKKGMQPVYNNPCWTCCSTT